ncbi:MAG: ABC transporter substrate-binding protein [Burkholderiales bacterium]|jgi:ABC-type nitrate/sulfonate/bicarbonate transport system substrate-binding protein|nr:ABC transporter substrate-binding protein [Burkholderiales bacterium]
MKQSIQKITFWSAVSALSLLVSCAATAPIIVPANTPETLRVNVFRGGSNIPIYMALEKGYFSRRGITVNLQFTPNSEQQRSGLAAGRFDIAHAAVDNAVAMIEVAKVDVVIVSGGDGGMNELLVRQDINKPADIRGRTYVVDAPNTAYALIGRKMFKNAGLIDGRDYKLDPIGGSEIRSKGLDTPAGAATMLNPPWNFVARDRGAKSLGRTIDLYGPYQASGAFVMRSWAKSNEQVLERYLAAFIEGCRAAQDPAQKKQVLAVLKRELKLDDRLTELTYQELMLKGSGLSKDCAIDMPGFKNVLALRAEIEGQWGGNPPAPEKFLDMSYFDKAKRHTMP